MIRYLRGRPIAAALALGIGAVQLPIAAHSEPTAARPMKLGYVELEDDPRYANKGTIDGIQFSDLGRPYQASQVALEDARAIGRVTKIDFSLEKVSGKSVDELVQKAGTWIDSEDVHFILADLPAPALLDLARRLKDKPVLLFNVSASDDSLRAADCMPNVVHTYPSEAMLSDALV
jgi:hypothetical protein